MRVRVHRVKIPGWSTVGVCQGTDLETGELVTFGADRRPARDLADAVRAARHEDELPVAEVEDWQVV